MTRRTHYSRQTIEMFLNKLELYRKALESGTSHDIIITSLQIHAASGTVPRSYKAMVNRVWKETKRTTPIA